MSHLDILNQIRDADYGEPGICCLQLFALDRSFFKSLQEEVLKICQSNPPSDVSQKNHLTHWTRPFGETLQFSLLNRSGRYNDPSTDHNLSTLGKRFHERRRYPTLASFIDAFPHCVNFRINWMGPGSGLSPHEEHVTMRTRTGQVGIRARFHLPVTTNRQAELMLEGHYYHLQEGIVYFINNGCVHSAQNGGPTARLHLVWDMLMTREACERMFGEEEVRPAPMTRLVRAGREVQPVHFEAVSAYERSRRPVQRAEAETVSYFDVQ